MAESVELVAVNQPHSLAGAILGLEERLRTRKNPQGSIALYQSNLQGNVDASHSMIHKIVIPSEARKVHHVRIWIYGEKYRAHATGSAAKAPDTVTSKATIPPTVTSGASSKTTNDATTPDTITSDISNPNTSASENSHTHTIQILGTAGSRSEELRVNTDHEIRTAWGQSGTITTSSESTHIHSVNHFHLCLGSGHLHGAAHTHQASGSPHRHWVQMMPHLHDLVFGIYEPASATAAITLKIADPDGVELNLGSMGSGEFSKEDFEVTEYFQKPGVYSVKFEADALGRVRSIVFAQVYLEPD